MHIVYTVSIYVCGSLYITYIYMSFYSISATHSKKKSKEEEPEMSKTMLLNCYKSCSIFVCELFKVWFIHVNTYIHIHKHNVNLLNIIWTPDSDVRIRMRAQSIGQLQATLSMSWSSPYIHRSGLYPYYWYIHTVHTYVHTAGLNIITYDKDHT